MYSMQLRFLLGLRRLIILVPIMMGGYISDAIANPTKSVLSTIPLTGKISTSAFTSNPYILGAGDQLEITVLGYLEFTGTKIILTDGTIALPAIGNVQAAGLSPSVLSQDLTKKLRPFLKNPVVTIGVLNKRPLLINVSGEVSRPGPIQLQNFNPAPSSSGSLQPEIPTLTSALLSSGGLTKNADLRKIELRRTLPTGEKLAISLNLWEALVSGNLSANVLLQDGDSIFVPKLTANDTLDRRLIARSTLAPKTVKVRVVGEVKKPGEVEVSPNSSISSAVAIAGGPTDKANLNGVIFIRLGEDGKVENQSIDLSNLTDTYQIQDGDVVIVPKSNSSTIFDIATQLANPLSVILNLFR